MCYAVSIRSRHTSSFSSSVILSLLLCYAGLGGRQTAQVPSTGLRENHFPMEPGHHMAPTVAPAVTCYTTETKKLTTPANTEAAVPCDGLGQSYWVQINHTVTHLLTILWTSVLPSFLGCSGLAWGELIHSWFGRMLSGEMSVNNGSSSRSLSLI